MWEQGGFVTWLNRDLRSQQPDSIDRTLPQQAGQRVKQQQPRGKRCFIGAPHTVEASEQTNGHHIWIIHGGGPPLCGEM